MRKIILLAALALALPGCETLGSIPASPAAVANATSLDETAARSAEVGYKAFRLALELAVDLGKVKGAKATQMAELDNRLYAAVQAVRAAYRGGNAASYSAAAKEATIALERAQAALSAS